MKKILLSVIGLLMAATTITAEDFDVTKDYHMLLCIESTQLPMTFKGNGVYEIITNEIGSKTFKIADMTFSINYGSNWNNVPIAEDYTMGKGGADMALAEVVTGYLEVRATFTADWTGVLHVKQTVEPTAVVNTKASSDIIVTTSNGTVFAEGEFTIFDLSGKNVTAQNGRLNGNYIVVVNNQSVKVGVK